MKDDRNWGLWCYVSPDDLVGWVTNSDGSDAAYTEEEARGYARTYSLGAARYEAKPFPVPAEGTREDRLQKALRTLGHFVAPPREPPRYLRVLTDGDVVRWTTHDTLDAAKECAATDYEQGWSCEGVWDLDTGEGFEAVVDVRLEANADKDVS